MSAFQKLFKQTFIYGLATVLPRMLSFLLVPLYTTVLKSAADYGKVSIIFSWFVIFNVILAYGMETAFFRFFHKKEEDKKSVVSTSTIALLITSGIFFTLALLFKDQIASITDINKKYISLIIWILFLDALVIIPFAWLRAMEKPMKYAFIKIINVAINIGLNLFFLLALKDLAAGSSFFDYFYRPDFEINYIFISNVIASAVTLLLIIPFYFKINYSFNFKLWRGMLKYAFPVLVAGLAFSINETFDRILLDYLLPKDIAETQIGMYSACYKLALFMTLFATAYRLGIEPFFFSHAKSNNPQKNYAKILEFFVALGSIILLATVVFSDILKQLIIRKEEYWEAMSIVPIILLANFCLGIYHNLSVWYKITDRTKFGAYISTFGAIITLIINFVLIGTLGYKASAIATLCAYGSMMLLSYFLGQKYYPVPYNIKRMSLYMLISIGLSLLSFYYFDRNLWIGSAFLLLFLGLVFYFEKNEFKKLLKKN